MTQPHNNSEAEDNSPPAGVFAGYAEQYVPLGEYAGLMGVYAAALAAGLATTQARGVLPNRLDTSDILLLGVATHKLTRIITKDWVTSPLRAPFTHYEKSVGGGEQSEKARGTGWRKALGDLLTCAWCTGPWVAGALTFGLLLKPRPTRVVASVLVMTTLSDYLHHAYDATKKAASKN